MSEPDWFFVRDLIDLDVNVTVRVTAIRDPYRFRWPLELECVTPDLSGMLTSGAPEFPPIFIYEDETEEEASVRCMPACLFMRV